MSASWRILAVELKGEMDNANRSTMDTYPSVGRFTNDHKVTLHTKGSSAKFSEFDRLKSLEPPRIVPAPPSSHHQPSPQPRPATEDIVDLRTTSGNGWKVPDPGSPSHDSTQRHCMWYNQGE